MKTHKLKLKSEYFDDVLSGKKTAEVRLNDRDYKSGDKLILLEWTGDNFTGRYILRKIVSMYKLDNIGIKNWVLLCMQEMC